MRSISYSMIFEVLVALSHGPVSIGQLSNACKIQEVYLGAVLSSAVATGLVDQRSDLLQLTKKGARTAIYLLIINDGMDYKSGDYRAIMRALDRALASDAQA